MARVLKYVHFINYLEIIVITKTKQLFKDYRNYEFEQIFNYLALFIKEICGFFVEKQRNCKT